MLFGSNRSARAGRPDDTYVTYFDEIKPDAKAGRNIYFIGGLCVPIELIATVEKELNSLAKEIFGSSQLTPETEFHAKHIYHGKAAFKGRDVLDRVDLLGRLTRIATSREEIKRVHSEIHIDRLKTNVDVPKAAFAFFCERVQRATRKGSTTLLIGDLDEVASTQVISEFSAYRAAGRTPWDYGGSGVACLMVQSPVGTTGLTGGLMDPLPQEKPTDAAWAEKQLLRGGAETHAPLLKAPPVGQKLFKVMSVENLLRSIEGGYLHFNRVDSYRDFPGADPNDGDQLPGDAPNNKAVTFEKRPDVSISDYYRTARGRTYACCFAVSNSAYIWENYGNGGNSGKVALVIDTEKLRARLNATVTGDTAAVMHGDRRCLQIFSVNYGLVEYVDRTSHRENTGNLPNPIRYTYLKDERFFEDEEFRVSLAAFGMGRFQLADGTELPFPPSLQLAFDFRAALNDGTIETILLSPDVDAGRLETELAGHEIRLVTAPS